MDVAGALSADECLEELRLQEISDKPWFIACVENQLGCSGPFSSLTHAVWLTVIVVVHVHRASNALTGEGVEVGIDWLCEQISRSGGARRK